MMAGQTRHDPVVALQCKDRGNQLYQQGEYHKAQILYTEAIKYDNTNPALYTNRAMANLKLATAAKSTATAQMHFECVIQDSLSSIRVWPENMKAYYNLAQAQLSTMRFEEAVVSAKKAHEFCVEEVYGKRGGQGAKNIGPVTELVLRCKKESWNAKEEARVLARGGLLKDVLDLLDKEVSDKVEKARAEGGLAYGEEEKKLLKDHAAKVEELKNTFEIAKAMGEEGNRRTVPDWCLDDITFSVMVDPVITKSGQSYDRSSILEHLKRSKTDPITRGILTPEDLIPNRVLKVACEEFLNENGWAADW